MQSSWLRVPLLGIVSLMILAGCASASQGGSRAEDVTLDIETLQVEVSEGTAKAEAVPNSFVGEVNDDLFIAVANPDDAHTYPPDTTIVYLCDGVEVAEWVAVDREEELSLEAGDVQVELAFGQNDVSGTVTLGDGDPINFTAEPPSGDAGLYRAEGEFDETAYTGAWIVLDEERQRGWWQYQDIEDQKQELQV